MLFFVFLSLVAVFDLLVGAGEAVSRDPGCPSPSGIASCASRLCRTHRRASIFVYFNYVTSGICAACEAFETFRASRDDRGCPCGSRSRNPLRPFGQGTCRGPPCACLEDRPHPRARVSQVRGARLGECSGMSPDEAVTRPVAIQFERARLFRGADLRGDRQRL